MSAVKLFHEVNKVWSELSTDKADGPISFDPETTEKFFNAFHVGSYYFYLFNVAEVRFEYMHPRLTELTGFPLDQVDVAYIVNHIHHDDQPWFLAFESKVLDFFAMLRLDQIPNYKVSYDYRIRRADGSYMRILQQTVTLEYNEAGKVIRTLGVHTDISHIKDPYCDQKPALSFIGLNGEPSFYNVDVAAEDLLLVDEEKQITNREHEVLNLLITGLKSTEIAQKLFISKLTVDTHRKNLLHKLKAENTAELVSKAIRMGWV